MRVGNDHVHQAMRRKRVFPGKGLVDARRGAIGFERQMFGPAHIAKHRAWKRRAGEGGEVRHGVRLNRFGVGRFQPIATRHLDRAKDDLQQMQRAGGLKAVGMRRYTPHRMKRNRAADHLLVSDAAEIGPGLGNLDRLVKRHPRQFGRQCANARGADATARRHRLGRVFGCKIALGHVLKHRPAALPCRAQIRLNPRAIPRRGRAAAAVDHDRLAFGIAQEQALFGAIGGVDQQGRVGEPRQIGKVELARRKQAMDQRQDHEPVGARRDAIPIIGNGVIAGADRVHAHHPRAARLELAQPDLDRVAVMVFGHAKQDEQLGAVPIGLSELPERAADGIDARRRHVDRAKAAVGGIVGGAESLRPPAGQRLRLVPPGEEGKLLGRRLAQRLHPRNRQRKRLIPADRLESARSARPDPLQRVLQPAGRGDLHDAAGALGAEHALVHRVIAVALNIAYAARAQMHVDAAAAGAHVAGGLAHLIRNGGRQRNMRLGHLEAPELAADFGKCDPC